jgi:hypothetical protein
MDDRTERHSSKHKRSHEKDPDRKSKKRHKHDDETSSRKHRRKDKEHSKLKITDDDPNDDDMWVEKNIDMDGERVSLYCAVFWVVFSSLDLPP